MVVVGLTGGIGSGKSTVAGLLARKGAVLVDADALARVVVAPGEPAHDAVLARFGEDLLDGHGTLDRAALAALVFSDEVARRDLEAIVHPCVEQLIRARLHEEATTDHVVVLEIPLLVESDARIRYPMDGVLVIDAPEDVALERLVSQRNMEEADARARIAAQASRAQRLQAADYIIMNIGTPAELEEMTNEAWRWMQRLESSDNSR